MEHMTERGTTAFKVFEFVDNAIGEIIEHIDRETILLIMSDHGFCSKKYSFNINQWLVSNGFLKYQRTKEKKEFDALNKLRNIQVEQNKENIHLSMRIKNKIKKIIFDMLIDLNIFKKYTIDWNSSLADIPTHNCFGIYINKNNVTDYEIFIDQLVEKMKDVIHLTTGEKVFKFVETTKKIYGKKPPDAPDILFLLHNDFSHRCVTNYTNREKPTIFSQVHGDDHSLFGIFLAYGPNITPSKLDTINIIDIAPTILNLMMYDAPPHMDGKSFFRQIYTADVPELKTLKDITRNKEDKTYLEKEKIKEQIKSLKL
jgi:predicted AlkP superfamily phosphohydrolase/phosphomutase